MNNNPFKKFKLQKKKIEKNENVNEKLYDDDSKSLINNTSDFLLIGHKYWKNITYGMYIHINYNDNTKGYGYVVANNQYDDCKQDICIVMKATLKKISDNKLTRTVPYKSIKNISVQLNAVQLTLLDLLKNSM
jgi:hypothetical protein